jgi:hypothetical protein
MITIVGLSGTLGAAPIAGVVIAKMSDHRLTGVRASGIRPIQSADGNPSTPGLPSRGW